MDLYSKKGGAYFRFNIWGWGRVWDFLNRIGANTSRFSGTNDGKLVPPKHCTDIAEHIEAIHARLKNLISAPKDQLLLEMVNAQKNPVMVVVNDTPVNLAAEIIQTRLKGGRISATRLIKEREGKWDHYDLFAYYNQFAKFCRKCARLGGFKIC